MKEEDRNKRLESRELTRLRRQYQDCKCYTLKIDESHLNSVQRNFLHMSFLEAKWFYNYVLSQTNIFDSSIRKVNSVVVKKLEEFEERELKYISSQVNKHNSKELYL